MIHPATIEAEDLPGVDLLSAILNKLSTESKVTYIGRQKSSFYGMADKKVKGIVQLEYKGAIIDSKRFQSRNERKLIMIGMRIKFDLFNDGRKDNFSFVVRLSS